MGRTACAAALISSSASGVGCIIVKSQKLDKGEAGMLGRLEIFLDAGERADGSETQILNSFFFFFFPQRTIILTSVEHDKLL